MKNIIKFLLHLFCSTFSPSNKKKKKRLLSWALFLFTIKVNIWAFSAVSQHAEWPTCLHWLQTDPGVFVLLTLHSIAISRDRHHWDGGYRQDGLGWEPELLRSKQRSRNTTNSPDCFMFDTSCPQREWVEMSEDRSCSSSTGPSQIKLPPSPHDQYQVWLTAAAFKDPRTLLLLASRMGGKQQ